MNYDFYELLVKYMNIGGLIGKYKIIDLEYEDNYMFITVSHNGHEYTTVILDDGYDYDLEEYYSDTDGDDESVYETVYNIYTSKAFQDKIEGMSGVKKITIPVYKVSRNDINNAPQSVKTQLYKPLPYEGMQHISLYDIVNGRARRYYFEGVGLDNSRSRTKYSVQTETLRDESHVSLPISKRTYDFLQKNMKQVDTREL